MVDIERAAKWCYHRSGLTSVILFLVALLPRILAPSGMFLNVDAAGQWIVRTKSFVLGLQGAGWAYLAPTGHPGVPLLWLTSLAEWLSQSTRWWEQAAQPIEMYVFSLKVPVMIATSVLVVVVWWLLKRAVSPVMAVAVSLLFALDPLYLMYSREVHLDALLTGFAFVGLLATWLARKEEGWKWSALAGCFFTLAVLTRMNALLIMFFGLVGLVVWSQTRSTWTLRKILIFLASAVVTTVVVWPPVVLAPEAVADQLRFWSLRGLAPHEVPSNVDIIPWVRPLLFPVFILTREFTLSLVLALVGAVITIRTVRRTWKDSISVFFLAFAVLYLAGIMFGQKHLDRYILPVIVTVTIVAGQGAAWLIEHWPPGRRFKISLIVLFGLIIQLTVFWRLQPYYQTYQNMIGRALQHTPVRTSAAMTPAWGEGMAEADAYLRAKLGRYPRVASWFQAVHCVYGREFDGQRFPFTLEPKVSCPPGLSGLSRAEQAEYILISRDTWAQRLFPALLRDIERLGWQPEHIVTINGHPYVWIYRNQGGLQALYLPADQPIPSVVY